MNQEAFMMKELMQCRHELEASRRLHAEYAERTHAAEKGAVKAKELMQGFIDVAFLTCKYDFSIAAPAPA